MIQFLMLKEIPSMLFRPTAFLIQGSHLPAVDTSTGMLEPGVGGCPMQSGGQGESDPFYCTCALLDIIPITKLGHVLTFFIDF